jgi:uncharacterized protein YjbI with pentapeptide repeats
MLKNDNNSQSELYHTIIKNDIVKAHEIIAKEDISDLESHSFRAVDLRNLQLEGQVVNFENCYFRNTDLRGLDLSLCLLDGASFHNARISGVLFPVDLPAQEIELSVIRGARVRIIKPKK